MNKLKKEIDNEIKEYLKTYAGTTIGNKIMGQHIQHRNNKNYKYYETVNYFLMLDNRKSAIELSIKISKLLTNYREVENEQGNKSKGGNGKRRNANESKGRIKKRAAK